MDLNKTIAVFGESNIPPTGRGPEVVAYNLLKGLDSLGVNYLNYCYNNLIKINMFSKLLIGALCFTQADAMKNREAANLVS